MCKSKKTKGMSIKVFISYSHDSEPHCESIVNFSDRLRDDGINCSIDKYWNGAPPDGWQRWMEQQIEQADFVLLVCTSTYLKKFKGEDKDAGRGVHFEGVIISQILYDSFQHNTKFIPLIPDDGDIDHVPLMLKCRSTYQISKDYCKLYRVLTNQPEYEKKATGPFKIFPPKNQQNIRQAAPLLFQTINTSDQEGQYKPWPISLGAVGLDRSRQVVICITNKPEQVCDELNAVENLLSDCPACTIFGRRTWITVPDPTDIDDKPNAIIDISPYVEDMGYITDLVIEHFEEHADTFAASVVLSLDPNSQYSLPDVSQELCYLQKNGKVNFSVHCLMPWSEEETLKQITPHQRKIVQQEKHLRKRGRKSIKNRTEHSLIDRIDSDSSSFFSNCRPVDVWLSVLAGHFGIPSEPLIGRNLQRALALLDAMNQSETLQQAVFSLPICKEVIEVLCASRVSIRAVVGLVSKVESLEQPPPWLNVPLHSRKGRGLVFTPKVN